MLARTPKSDLRREQCRGAFGVPLHLAADQLTQGEHHRVCNMVLDGRSFAFAFHEPVLMEHAQVFGNVGLFQPAGFHQLMHCQRSALEGLQERQPAGFGKRGKQAGDGLQLTGGQAFDGSRFRITQ